MILTALLGLLAAVLGFLVGLRARGLDDYERGKLDGQRLERLNTWCGMRRFEPVVKAERERVN